MRVDSFALVDNITGCGRVIGRLEEDLGWILLKKGPAVHLDNDICGYTENPE
jgi:hypothetical protein